MTLFDTGKIAGAGLDLDTLVNRVLERCIESTDATKGAVFLLNPYTEQLELGAAEGLAPAPPFHRHKGIFGALLDEEKPILRREYPKEYKGQHEFEPESLVACAIHHDSVPVGLLMIGDRAGGAPFNGGHLHLLQGIALQVAPAISHARAKAEEAAAAAHNRHFVTF